MTRPESELHTITSGTITASFRWSKDEFLLAQRSAVQNMQQIRLLYRFISIIGVLILLSGGVSLYQRTTGWTGFLFTAFVGLNLFQSAFTDWCPMMTFLRKLGIPR